MGWFKPPTTGLCASSIAVLFESALSEDLLLKDEKSPKEVRKLVSLLSPEMFWVLERPVHILLNLVESGIMCQLQCIYRFFNPGEAIFQVFLLNVYVWLYEHYSKYLSTISTAQIFDGCVIHASFPSQNDNKPSKKRLLAVTSGMQCQGCKNNEIPARGEANN